MHSDRQNHDPFSRKEFWLNQLSAKSTRDLEEYLLDFEQFAAAMEEEFRFVMSASRADACRLALEELLTARRRQAANSNQGDLFR